MKTKMLVNTQNRKCSYPSAVYDHCRIRDRWGQAIGYGGVHSQVTEATAACRTSGIILQSRNYRRRLPYRLETRWEHVRHLSQRPHLRTRRGCYKPVEKVLKEALYRQGDRKTQYSTSKSRKEYLAALNGADTSRISAAGGTRIRLILFYTFVFCRLKIGRNRVFNFTRFI